MPWNSVVPVITTSVKANKTVIQENTTYIETTLGNTANDIAYATSQKDHYWDVSSDLDGHHRFVKMPAYTVGGTASDPGPDLGTSMGGILYLKTTNNRVEGFYRNNEGIYQYIPSYLTGTKAVTDSYSNIVAVPANVYGEIFMVRAPTSVNDSRFSFQTGYFASTADTVYSFAIPYSREGSSSYDNALKFGNGTDASGLNIRVRNGSSPNATWTYYITYRAR